MRANSEHPRSSNVRNTAQVSRLNKGQPPNKLSSSNGKLQNDMIETGMGNVKIVLEGRIFNHTQITSHRPPKFFSRSWEMTRVGHALVLISPT